MKYTRIAAPAAVVAMSTTASAQLTLAWDVNGYAYSFFDAAGVRAFGGTSHTGTVEWSFSPSPPTKIADVRMGTQGRFGELMDVILGAELEDFEGMIEFDSGVVQGGELSITLDSGDVYSASLRGGSGRIQAQTTGGFTLDSMTFDGRFSDDMFGDIDVSEFVAMQVEPEQLFGSLFGFRFEPNAMASGAGDAEVYVTLIPLPPALPMGLASLLGVMGLTVVLRRR